MTGSLHQLYAVQPIGFELAEARAVSSRTVPEKLVRCLWFDWRWRPPVLRTLAGQEVVVHDPGRWNVQAGPDFRQAVIEFGSGTRQQGDVEIHRFASGWAAHRHHLDARYNRVILHVFLWNDRQAVEVRRADGQAVPQIALEAHLSRPVAAYQDDIVLEDYPSKHAPVPGRCYEALRWLERSVVQRFLNAAGDLRLQQRMLRWAGRAAEVGLVQVMYEAVMRSLGSMGHRQQFQKLARRVAWQELQGCLVGVPAAARGVAAEALLLGLAGILQRPDEAGVAMDRETQRYLGRLWEYWAGFPTSIRQCAWHDVTWRQPYVRPANTPERRLAAMARLLARYHTTSLLEAGLTQCHSFIGQDKVAAARGLCKALTGLFDLTLTSYWNRHTYLGGRTGKAQRLIGSQCALTTVIDAVLPVLLLLAQGSKQASLHTSLLACYHAAPRLPDNALLRYMKRRLLGDDPALLPLVAGARQQQGLLQIFHDYCDNDEGGCRGCDVPLVSASSVGSEDERK
jgi:hypothetical protein